MRLWFVKRSRMLLQRILTIERISNRHRCCTEVVNGKHSNQVIEVMLWAMPAQVQILSASIFLRDPGDFCGTQCVSLALRLLRMARGFDGLDGSNFRSGPRSRYSTDNQMRARPRLDTKPTFGRPWRTWPKIVHGQHRSVSNQSPPEKIRDLFILVASSREETPRSWWSYDPIIALLFATWSRGCWVHSRSRPEMGGSCEWAGHLDPGEAGLQPIQAGCTTRTG